MTRPRAWIALLVSAIALVYASWILRFGLRSGGDVVMYSAWADVLIAHRFNYAEYLRDVSYGIPSFLYVAWVTVVAAAKLVAGNHWRMFLVGLNWVSVVMVAWLVLTIVWSRTSSAIALMVSGLLLVNFDLLDFVRFPLSDVVFVGLVTAILAMSISVAERPAAPVVIAGTIAAVIACFFRPTAAPVASVWVIALLWPRLSANAKRRIVPAIVALILVAIAIHAAMMQDLSLWPAERAPGWLEGLRDNYHAGVIVNGRPQVNVPPPEHYADFVAIMFRRWAYYFAITMPGYSTRHMILNVVYYVPAYALALAGILFRPPDARRSTATMLMLLMILLTSAFHGMLTIDFDHRYRLPILPALITLAAIGSAEAAARLRRCDPER